MNEVLGSVFDTAQNSGVAHTPTITALGRGRFKKKFKVILGYIGSLKTVMKQFIVSVIT